MRWNHTPLLPAEVAALSQGAGVSPILAELLWRAGIREPAAVGGFLEPALAGLGDPFLLPNLEAVAVRLHAAIVRGERVVVLGDYDVDGVTSTALLVTVLRRFGLSPRFIVPRRAEDGYGLSRSAIDRALEQGQPHLFIASPIFYWWHKGDRKHVEAHADVSPKYEWTGSSKASQ